MTQQEYAIIVAGGKGTRFGTAVPKQFLSLRGKPVLLHTLEAFYQYSDQIKVILVLPEDEVPQWNDIIKKFDYKRSLTVQYGGATRFQSVKKGLDLIRGNGLVAIHDGVRPLVTPDLIAASFRYAAVHHSAICSVPLKESLRIIAGTHASGEGWHKGSQALDRSRYRLIQTPQTFDVSLLKEAYEVAEDPAMTDDASVFEKAGHPVFLFEGNYENIKITTSEDLGIAESLLNYRQNKGLSGISRVEA